MKYDVGYWVSDCDGTNIPRRSAFQPVRGCDLSPIGISFYADAPPKSNQVALMFKGRKSEAYMLARVIHMDPCLLDGQRRYLVGCQFVRSLNPEDDE
jgi:hypothetical protein